MKGLFVTGVNETAILDLPEPEPGPYEALVEVLACGICNSTDHKIIAGEFVSGSFPILLGHESVGRVVQVGERVTHFRPGDVVLRSRLEDEHVPFVGARSCWGGFVEKALVTDMWAAKGESYNAFPHPQQIVPLGIPPTHAAALITLKETLSCIENSDVRPGQSLAIVGTGPVAQSLACFAHLLDIHPTVVFGRRPIWAETFARLGADDYAAGDAFPPQVKDILARGGFDRAIEAVGARSALSRCLQVVRPSGRVNLYGIAPESEPYLPEEEADPRVFRARVTEADMHEKLLSWVDHGRVDLGQWISHVIPWTEYQCGLDMVEHKTANKVVLQYGSAPAKRGAKGGCDV
jgi:threonine dehydrogenase-like Zn-dependent dehydrogenase